MVRLEETLADRLKQKIISFNSTMVRLEAEAVTFENLSAKFQFHDGAIRR